MIKKIETIVSIAAIAFILYIFTFYIEGEMGVVLIAFLIVPPLVSFLSAFYARKRITVSIFSDAYVKKGSELEVTVTIEKKGKVYYNAIKVNQKIYALIFYKNKYYL